MDIHFKRQMMSMTFFLSLSALCRGNVVVNARPRRAADVSGVGQGKRNAQPKIINVMPHIQDGGSELLANTTKGLYYSRNGGRSWVRR